MIGKRYVMVAFLVAAVCGGCGKIGNAPGNAAGFTGSVANDRPQQARAWEGSNRTTDDFARDIRTQSYRMDSSTHTLHVELGFNADSATRAGSQLKLPRSGGVRNNVLSFTIPVGWTIKVYGPQTWNGTLSVVHLPNGVFQPGSPDEQTQPAGSSTTAVFHAMSPGEYGIVFRSRNGDDHLIDVVTVSSHAKLPSVGETRPFHRTTQRPSFP